MEANSLVVCGTGVCLHEIIINSTINHSTTVMTSLKGNTIILSNHNISHYGSDIFCPTKMCSSSREPHNKSFSVSWATGSMQEPEDTVILWLCSGYPAVPVVSRVISTSAGNRASKVSLSDGWGTTQCQEHGT